MNLGKMARAMKGLINGRPLWWREGREWAREQLRVARSSDYLRADLRMFHILLYFL